MPAFSLHTQHADKHRPTTQAPSSSHLLPGPAAPASPAPLQAPASALHLSKEHGPYPYSAASYFYNDPVLGDPYAAPTRARDAGLHSGTSGRVLACIPLPLFPLSSPFPTHVPPSPCFQTRQTGVALGLVVLLILSAYPGEPFDYSKPDGGRTKREGAMAVGGKLKTEEEEEEDMDKVEVRVAADGCGTTFGSSSSSGSISGMTTTTTTTTSVRHRRSHSKNDSKSTRGRNGSSSSSSSEEHDGLNHAKTEALHRLLVQEDRVWQRLQHWPPALRGILGLSEDGVRMAVRQAARGRDGGKEVQQQEEGGSAGKDGV